MIQNKMENKELKKQLSSLKNIVPDSGWKERNREILLSQISNSEVAVSAEAKGFADILILPQKIARVFSAPSWAVFFVCALVLSGSVFSVGAAHLSKPDSSLYIARIISEKARLAVTFNKEEKTKLSFKFASDHAKDITEILANTDLDDETGKVKTEKLTENFKQEIKVAKNKLKEMKVPEGSASTNKGSEDANIFSANLGRDEKGVQISEPKNPNIEIAKQLVPLVSKNIEQEEKATTTPANTEPASPSDSAHKVLEEAEDLFDVKDYGGALNKLQEANNIVENINTEEKGEVKGVSEGSATSTQE